MAYTTIDKPTDYFNTLTYTGNGTADRGITGVGFQPDWVWIKNRTDVSSHKIFDSVRGAGLEIESDTSDAEAGTLDAGKLPSFDSDGFTVSASNTVNGSSDNMVAWNWKAGGTASSNTDGATTASVSVNTTSGISIASVAGNSTNFGHGLGVAPNVIIYKPTSAIGSWGVACDALGMTSGYLGLNSTAAFVSGSGFINGTSSTLVTVGSSIANVTNIYYMFAEKKGYSKFGSYTGNGNADGTFVYTGFKPAMVILKRTDSAGDWFINDNKRDTFNDVNHYLRPHTSAAETSGTALLDFTSNGFKNRINDAAYNGSGATYIYMAFAESPFVTSTGIPTTAR